MTEADRQAFTTGFLKMCACYSKPFDAQQCAAYFESPLRLRSLASVLEAMEHATLTSGRYMPSVGLIAEVANERSGPGRETGMAHAPTIYRDEATGAVVARWRCVFCEDTGWRAKETATGRLLTNEELILRQEALRVPREDSEPTYAMSRCACKTGGALAVAS